MRRQVDIDKDVTYSIVINAVQILAVIGIAILVLVTDIESRSVVFVEFIICLAAALVAWGAVVDITQALSARRINEQSQMLSEAYGQLEALNTSLRAQRHDFMNHLQVVGSLVEMGEYAEAADYVERVYGDVQALPGALRTGNPAVNALMKVKFAESQSRGVYLEVKALSRWDGLPVQGWQMCRVLGNLIDNALDALEGTPGPRLTVTFSEDEAAYRFAVENNGPEVPEDIRARIFLPGVTTKGRERGMGLSIVRSVLKENGGEISLETNSEKTVFLGCVPKRRPLVDAVDQAPARA